MPKLRLDLPTTGVDDCTCIYPEPAEWDTRDAGYIVRAASSCCVQRTCGNIQNELATGPTEKSSVYNIWFRSPKIRVAPIDNVLYGQDSVTSFGSTQGAQHSGASKGIDNAARCRTVRKKTKTDLDECMRECRRVRQ